MMCGLCWAAGVGCVWHEVVLLLGVSGVVVVDVGDQCVGVVVFGAVFFSSCGWMNLCISRHTRCM